MLVPIIVTIAVLAFLIVMCYIFRENIKAFFSRSKKQKKQQPQPQPKQEFKAEDFIPLKNQFDDQERDASLDALFSDDFVNPLESEVDSTAQSNDNSYEEEDLDAIFGMKGASSKRKTQSKPIAEQIKDLSPEMKALLLDTALKKRDDV